MQILANISPLFGVLNAKWDLWNWKLGFKHKHLKNQEAPHQEGNQYSILYYNFEVWLGPHQKSNLKQQPLSVSANALRSCKNGLCEAISFKKIHQDSMRSTSKQMTNYGIKLQLYNVFNEEHWNCRISCFHNL